MWLVLVFVILSLVGQPKAKARYCSEYFGNKRLIENFGRTKAGRGHIRWFTKWAGQLKSDGDLNGAVRLYEQALKMDPNNAIALSQAGYLLLMMGHYKSARRRLDHAQAIEPHNRQVFSNRLQVRIAQGDTLAVETMVRKMGESNLRTIGEVSLFLLTRNYKPALALLEGAPETPTFFRLRAQVYYHLGRFDKAAENLAMAIIKNPAPDYQSMAALIRLDMGEVRINEYKPGPEVSALLKKFNKSDLVKLLAIRESDLWSFQPMPAPRDRGKIFNTFWNPDSSSINPRNSSTATVVGTRYEHD